jgi:hypothetical protein
LLLGFHRGSYILTRHLPQSKDLTIVMAELHVTGSTADGFDAVMASGIEKYMSVAILIARQPFAQLV